MRRLSRLLLLSTLLVVSQSALAQSAETKVFDKAAKDEVLAEIEKIITERAFVPGIDLKKWPEHVQKQREEIDKAESESDFSRAVSRALREFGFSHISLRTPRARQTRTEGAVVGVGVSARMDNDALVVTSLFPESPAAQAGLKVGDRIISIDGKAPTSADALSGDAETEVTIKFKNAEGEEKEVKLQRRRFSTARKDTVTWINGESAVLRINSFAPRAYDQRAIETLMEEVASKGAKSLILDLRSNGGGATNHLQHLLSLLLPSDSVIGTFISRGTANRFAEEVKGDASDPVAIAKWTDRKYKTSKRRLDPFTGKVAVLINRGSASASEICAMALRENLKAPIIGSRSAGAVLASVYGRLPHGFEIQYPVMDYVTKDFIRLEGNPIQPDHEVTTRPEQGKDPQVEKALEILKGK